ncbi:hypothetical protein TrVGV298_011238, partial [Trichoderma virens]
MLWLAGRASADGGDDFANNLASDLGPIIALFGERVVMQFMSQAMGITDCILLAVAPIGAITTVISAIRVAGPPWLKSFIGRARENLSAAEIDVMSSTSKEACELWNGHSVIRCPGSADIYQFICLLPKGRDTGKTDESAKNSVMISTVHSIRRRDTGKTESGKTDSGKTDSEQTDSDKAGSGNGDSDTQQDSDKDAKDIIVVVDSDDSAPNLLLNCHDRVERREIYLAATLGVILQLGALIYFAFITYHQPIKDQFLKDGRRVVEYAFPCAAGGTLLLVLGLFMCAWVVEKSTTETCYEAKHHRMFIVWLQKHHTLSDQVFRPFAIYPTTERKYITMSRRNITSLKQDNSGSDHPQTSLGEGITNAQTSNKHIAFFGSLISLVGFISQFIGMRGLNWTASVVQLGITIVVTVLRVIVRRGLGKSPNRTPLISKTELDWFALSFGDLTTAPWAMLDDKSKNENKKKARKHNHFPKWRVCTGDKQAYLPLRTTDDSSRSEKKSKVHEMMIARQELKKISNWKSPVAEEAARLSAAIEAVVHSLLGEEWPDGDYTWSIPATYNGSQDGYLDIELEKKDKKWNFKDMGERIEAILSLWSYSATPAKVFDINQPRQLRLYGSSEHEDRLRRDLQWWMPEVITEITTLPKAEVDEKKMKPEWTIVGFTSEISQNTKYSDKPEGENSPSQEYLVLECQEKQKRLFSRDLLFSFMRAIAKMPEVTISSASSVQQVNYSKMTDGWKELKIKNDTISNLARKLEKIGFGTLSDIYFDLIVPLSLEQKLTNLKNVIDEATEQAQAYERTCQWKKLVDSCFCLLDLALRFDLEREPSGPLAIAVCLGFLSRLRHESALQKSEGREEEELAKQLKLLIQKLKEEPFTKLPNFEIPAREKMKEWHYAMPFNTMIGHALTDIKTLPDSFRITTDHQTDAFGWSPLHYAANLQLQNMRIVFSPEGEVLNLRDYMGWTPLQHACLVGNERVVDMLLDREAPIDTAGYDGITPMHCAVRSGNIEILQRLVEKSKSGRKRHSRNSVAHVDRNERHPIHWAAVKGDVQLIWLLKDDIGLKDRFGWTCLHLAAIYGHKELLLLIIEDCGADINIGDNDARTPLHLAIENDKEAVIPLLINAHADVNVKAKDGSTPLHMAVKRKDIVQILLDNDADMEAIDLEGRTPLYQALADGTIGVADLLIDKGADVATAAKDGRTPLHMALTEYGPPEAIELLLKLGADIDAWDDFGQTPLLISIYKKNWGIAELLLKEGAD